jgi:hypothetical protein
MTAQKLIGTSQTAKTTVRMTVFSPPATISRSSQIDHHSKESTVNRSIRLLALLGVIALPSAASAQSITGSIAASADIATVFSFGAPSALSFGSVTPGTAATASGYIPLSRNIGVIYSLPDGAATGQLTGPSATTLLPTYTCGVGSTNSVIVSAFTSCSAAGNQLTLAAPAGVVTEYVIFNGSLSAAQTNTVPGSYVGTIRVTATGN